MTVLDSVVREKRQLNENKRKKIKCFFFLSPVFPLLRRFAHIPVVVALLLLLR